MPFNIRNTPIPDLVVAESQPISDQRGSFMRLFCAKELAELLGGRTIAQINHSLTRRAGTVRGLHFQKPPYAEMKLVRCLKGRVWDVAVDLRPESATRLQWHGEELGADNGRMMIIPEGFAHGFQSLEDNSELLYLHTHAYTPAAEGGLRYNAPRLAIGWPLVPAGMSARDLALPIDDPAMAEAP